MSKKYIYIEDLGDLLNENIFFMFEILLFLLPSIYFSYMYLKFKITKYLILFFLFISVFFLLDIFKYDMVKYFNEDYGYRLGDMVFKENSRYQLNGEKYHYKFYPKSIASEYMRRTDKQGDFETLLNIIKEKNNIKQKEEDLVIHLRTGDSLNKNKNSVDELLNRKVSHPTIKNYNYYIDLKIHDKIDRIILVSSVKSGGGTRSSDNFSKSYKYIEKIKDFFANKGYIVETRLNQDADEDFVFMSTAKNFVPSGGNYSKLIKNLVLLNKNNVY